MTFGQALLFSLMGGYFTVLVVSFWTNKLGEGISGKGILITGLLSFFATYLFLVFAPEKLFTPAALIFVGIVTVTLIAFWLTE